jgi:hypothetical protein
MQTNTEKEIEEAEIISETKHDDLLTELSKKPNTVEVNNPFVTPGSNATNGDASEQQPAKKPKFVFQNSYSEKEPPGDKSTDNDDDDDEAFSPEELSDLIVDGIDDIINQFALPKWHEYQLMSKFSPELIAEVDRKLDEREYARANGQAITITFMPDEQKVTKAMSEVVKYNKSTPFTPKEKTTLKKRWSTWLKSLNWEKDIPPGWALVTSMVMIQGKRVITPLKNEAEKLL